MIPRQIPVESCDTVTLCNILSKLFRLKLDLKGAFTPLPPPPALGMSWETARKKVLDFREFLLLCCQTSKILNIGQRSIVFYVAVLQFCQWHADNMLKFIQA